jgi:hypothetical protein
VSDGLESVLKGCRHDLLEMLSRHWFRENEENHKNLSRNSLCRSRDSNRALAKYKSKFDISVGVLSDLSDDGLRFVPRLSRHYLW